jgi:hypothetical protein
MLTQIPEFHLLANMLKILYTDNSRGFACQVIKYVESNKEETMKRIERTPHLSILFTFA